MEHRSAEGCWGSLSGGGEGLLYTLPEQDFHAWSVKPRVQVQVPKPQPRGEEEEVTADYKSPLDKLAKLDKNYKDKNFGFYGGQLMPKL